MKQLKPWNPNSFSTRMLDFLFPRKCAVCKIHTGRAVLCPGCSKLLSKPASPWLEASGLGLDSLAAAFFYKNTGAALLGRFKFHRDYACYELPLRKVFEQTMCACYGSCGLSVVTCMPMSAPRRRQRGFNQAEYIGARLALVLGVPFDPCLLAQTGKKHLSQHDLPHEERAANVAGLYTASPRAAGCSVLVVDDVVTTGSSLAACAHALRQAGASCVCGAAVLTAGVLRTKVHEK